MVENHSKAMSMFLVVFFVTIYYTRIQCLLSKIMIWDKAQQNFVELLNVSQYVDFQEQTFVKERDTVVEDISEKVLKVSYYEEKYLVMFYDNDTKVTGICGEIWNLIADMVNITLMPVRHKERDFGVHLENGSYSGLLGLFNRNETDVIMRTGYYSSRLDILHYTMPIWRTNFQLYIRPKYTYDNNWIRTTFSAEAWCVLIFLFTILTVAGYVLQNEYYQNSKRRKRGKRRDEYFGFNDHLFYTYSTMCGQGYLPNAFYEQNRILSLSKSMFAWLISLSFSSSLIYRMTYRTIIPPFKDFNSLLNHTEYDVLIFKGSMIYEFLEKGFGQLDKTHQHRIHFVDNPYSMYTEICKGKNLYAMLETQDKFNTGRKSACTLMPVGDSYFQTWIGFGIQKHLPYKKIINVSILKLYETGLLDTLKNRWLAYRISNKDNHPFQAIDMQQIHLMFYLLLTGAVFSLIILFFEKIIFLCKSERK